MLNHAETIDTVTVEADGRTFEMRVRLDTSREVTYYRHGGILRFVARSLASSSQDLRKVMP